jgi:hypothetical protein
MNSIWRRTVRIIVVLPLLSVASSATLHCGGSDGNGLLSGDGGTDAGTHRDGGDAALPSFGDADCRSVGVACAEAADCCVGACTAGVCGGAATAEAGGAKACNPNDGACVKGFDCCSGTCASGLCQGSVSGEAGASGGTCTQPAASCTTSPQCCSGLCEPVTGQAGVVECKDACRADGVACASAQDCCSLGCFGGVCTSMLCAIVGDPCAASGDCCSGVCNAQSQCDVDLANSTCRPTGEDCGKGPQSGCCGATKDDDLCGPAGRCVLPPGACRGQTASCAADGDCCSKHCDPGTGTCTTPCVSSGGACTTGGDCCTSSCTNATCDTAVPPTPPGGAEAGAPPAQPVCQVVGTSCTAGAQCCSALCLAGFCDLTPPLQ